MWFGYVPQIKNTNVISARGPPLFSFAPSSPAGVAISPGGFVLVALVVCRRPRRRHRSFRRSSRYPTDISAFRVSAENGAYLRSTGAHAYTYTCRHVYTGALAYKLLFSETGERESSRQVDVPRPRQGIEEVYERARARQRERGGRNGCGDGTIRAAKSVCSVKLSLRGSSPANLWDTYNASQEYCSVCRPSTLCFPLSRPVTSTRPACTADALRHSARETKELSSKPNIETYDTRRTSGRALSTADRSV